MTGDAFLAQLIIEGIAHATRLIATDEADLVLVRML